MGIFKRLFGVKDKELRDPISATVESLDQERITHMFERPSSFSLIAIPGNVGSEIPVFLSACGYTLLRTGGYRGQFADLYAGIERPFGPDNSIVQKAWYEAASHTILVDPEMVLITEITRLSEMASKVGGTIKAAIWERVSESVAMVEIGPQGVTRQSWYCEGERSDKAIDEHPEIAAQPDSEGLNAALTSYGFMKDRLFGEVDATIAEFQE